MKNLTIIALFIALSFQARGENTGILIQKIKTTQSKVEKAKYQNLLSEQYQESDPELMLKYAQAAIITSKTIKNTAILGRANQNAGVAFLIMGDYDKALEHFTEAGQLYKKALREIHTKNSKEFQNGLARAYGSMGIVYSEQSNTSQALYYYLKAIKINRKIKNLDNTARLYNNVGIVLLNNGNNKEALKYYLKCLKLQQIIKDPTIGITYTNLGNIFCKRGNLPKAKFYYDKAKKSFDKNPNPRGLGELYNNLALYYRKNGNKAAAIKELERAIEVFNSINDKFGTSDSYFYLGEIYFEEKNYNKAIAFVQLSLQLSKELEVAEQIKNGEEKLYQMYQEMSDPEKALAHFISYSKIKDSLQNHEIIRNNIKAELNFEFDKKELLLQQEKEKNALIYSEKTKRNQLIFFFILLFIVLIFVSLLIQYKKHQLHKTVRLKLEIAEYEQKALHLQMNPHFLFNCLGSISSYIIQNNADEAIKYLAKFSKLMRLTLEFSKVPLITIDREIESLANYLELEQLRFNKNFSFEISKSEEVEDDIALPSLLIQPFVENSVIHGIAQKKGDGQIQIKFYIENKHLICIIRDNGIGILHSKKQKENLVKLHKSMALTITKERLKMMEASLSQKTNIEIIELTDKNQQVLGTQVTILLPIQYIN